MPRTNRTHPNRFLALCSITCIFCKASILSFEDKSPCTNVTYSSRKSFATFVYMLELIPRFRKLTCINLLTWSNKLFSTSQFPSFWLSSALMAFAGNCTVFWIGRTSIASGEPKSKWYFAKSGSLATRIAHICHAKALESELSPWPDCEVSQGGRTSRKVGLYIRGSVGQRFLLYWLVSCSSLVNHKSWRLAPMYGANVAAVTLTCVPWWPATGCATLKSMSKLLYTIFPGGKVLSREFTCLRSDLTVFLVVLGDTVTPMCANISLMISGVHFESQKKLIMDWNMLKFSFELLPITEVTKMHFCTGWCKLVMSIESKIWHSQWWGELHFF